MAMIIHLMRMTFYGIRDQLEMEMVLSGIIIIIHLWMEIQEHLSVVLQLHLLRSLNTGSIQINQWEFMLIMMINGIQLLNFRISKFLKIMLIHLILIYMIGNICLIVFTIIIRKINHGI